MSSFAYIVFAGVIGLLFSQLIGRHRSSGATVTVPGSASGSSGILAPAMAVIICLAVLTAALYVVVQGTYSEDAQKWAFGAVGNVVGFWIGKIK